MTNDSSNREPDNRADRISIQFRKTERPFDHAARLRSFEIAAEIFEAADSRGPLGMSL